MPRPSNLDEWWPHLLRMERYCLERGLIPHAAAVQIVGECRHLPGTSDPQSKVKMLEQYERKYRDELTAELGPLTVECMITVESPTKLTLARRWLSKLGRARQKYQETR